MELLTNPAIAALSVAEAPLVARYRPVLWEPIEGTGERLVAMLAVQAHESTTEAVSPATYPVLSAQRLRSLLGRQRGSSAVGILRECAGYMTNRQSAGLQLEELRPLFRGFAMGPMMVARAWSVQQLLDAAVRSVSVLGSAEEMIQEEESRQSPRHMIRTAEFLTALRRIFTGQSKDLASRFDVPLRAVPNAPEVVIDYACGPLAVQVTSLPSTAKQAENCEREAQSKMFELGVARQQMSGNRFVPTLLFNTDALAEEVGSEARKHAEAARDRLTALARFNTIDVMEASNPSLAARLLDGRSVCA